MLRGCNKSNSRAFFFFSSRRRHTRCSRDWSSDVCSSDLARSDRERDAREQRRVAEVHAHAAERDLAHGCALDRSEERRVGKECRSRGGPYHQKKKKETRQRQTQTGRRKQYLYNSPQTTSP